MRFLVLLLALCLPLAAQEISGGGGGGGGAFATGVTAGTYANLPSEPSEGNLYLITSGVYQFARYDGSAWDVFLDGVEITVPPSTGWTTVGAGTTPTISQTNGYISIFSNNADDWAAYLRAAPTAPYTIRTFVKLHGLETAVDVGIGWQDGTNAASSKGQFLHLTWTVATAERIRYRISNTNALDPVSSAGAQTGFDFTDADPLIDVSAGFWVELGDNETNRTVRISNDGINWYSYSSFTRTTHLTPTHVGVFVERSVTSTTMVVADWTEN